MGRKLLIHCVNKNGARSNQANTMFMGVK